MCCTKAVVARELGQLAVAQQVGARVADVGQRVGAVVGEGDRGQRGAHAGHLRAVGADEADRVVAPGDRVAQGVVKRPAEPGLVEVLQRLDDPAAGDLTRCGAADAVGHRRDPRRGIDRVLVVLASPDVAPGRAFQAELAITTRIVRLSWVRAVTFASTAAFSTFVRLTIPQQSIESRRPWIGTASTATGTRPRTTACAAMPHWSRPSKRTSPSTTGPSRACGARRSRRTTVRRSTCASCGPRRSGRRSPR